MHSSLNAFAVPTNNGWEKVKRDFSQVFASLTSLQTPDYVSLPAKILRQKTQNMICSFTIKAETRDRLKSKKNDDKINKSNDLQPKQIMLRHVIISSRAFTIEQLAEKSLRSPLRTVKTEVNVTCIYAIYIFCYLLFLGHPVYIETHKLVQNLVLKGHAVLFREEI